MLVEPARVVAQIGVLARTPPTALPFNTGLTDSPKGWTHWRSIGTAMSVSLAGLSLTGVSPLIARRRISAIEATAARVNR
jgi:hypothetical protein